jgi:TonB family protein
VIHFDLEDRYQDELVVGSAISRREGLFLSIVMHGLVLALFLYGGRLALLQPDPEELELQREERARLEQEQRDRNRFVFVQPKVDFEARQLRERLELSDIDRRSATPERAPRPENELPRALGNSAERAEATQPEQARGPETPEPPQPEPTPAEPLPQDERGLSREQPQEPPKAAGGALGDALKNLQRYVQNETFHNPQGGQTDPGATIQFDTKGVQFGPWLRRFVSQVRRNWFVPNAAMTFSGRVVLQFNIHKNGRITDVVVAQASTIDAFNRSAVNAILGSNPTEPLPPEYPDERAFFTVTFFYNEQPGN